MSRNAWLALLLATSHLFTVLVTCPTLQPTPLAAAVTPPSSPVSHALPDREGAAEMHAHHDGSHAGEKDLPPCHAPALSLKAPCPCGCAGGVPTARAGLFGAGEMALVAALPSFGEGLPLRGGAPAPSTAIARPSPIDHVPISA